MKNKKEIANIVAIITLSVFCVCLLVPVFFGEVVKIVVDNLPAYISIISLLLIVSVISVILSDPHLDHLEFNLDASIRHRSWLLSEIIECKNEIVTKQSNAYGILETKQGEIEDLLGYEDVFNITPDLKKMLSQLKTLYGDCKDIFNDKCKTFIGYIEQNIENFKNDDFLNTFDQSLKLLNSKFESSDEKLSIKNSDIDKVTSQIKEQISILEKQGNKQEFITKLKSCIGYTDFQSHRQKVDSIISSSMSDVSLLKNQELKIQDLIYKITVIENPKSVSSEPSIISCGESSKKSM